MGCTDMGMLLSETALLFLLNATAELAGRCGRARKGRNYAEVETLARVLL